MARERADGGIDFDGMRIRLVGVAWRITGDREQAHDTVQDVFLSYLSAPEKFSGTASPWNDEMWKRLQALK